MTTLQEVEQNRGVYGVWEKKFPSQTGVEPVKEEVLYENYGRMNAAETMENFLGMLSGKEVRLPAEVRSDLIRRLPE